MEGMYNSIMTRDKYFYSYDCACTVPGRIQTACRESRYCDLKKIAHTQRRPVHLSPPPQRKCLRR